MPCLQWFGPSLIPLPTMGDWDALYERHIAPLGHNARVHPAGVSGAAETGIW